MARPKSIENKKDQEEKINGIEPNEIEDLKAQLIAEKEKNKALENQSPEQLRQLAQDKSKPKAIMTINGIDVYDVVDSQRYSEYLSSIGKLDEASGNSIFDKSGNVVDSGARATFVNPDSYFGARYFINKGKLEVVNTHRLVSGFDHTEKIGNEIKGYVVTLDKNGKATDEIKITSFNKEYYLKNFSKKMPIIDAIKFYSKTINAVIEEEQESLFGF